MKAPNPWHIIGWLVLGFLGAVGLSLVVVILAALFD